MKSGEWLSIWLFIGVTLLVNGALIDATGIHEIVSSAGKSGVFYDSHPQHLVEQTAVDCWRFLLFAFLAGAGACANYR